MFLVGMRVAILLDASHVLPVAENTFRLLPPASFCVETTLQISFIITSIFIMFLFRPGKFENDEGKVAFIAATLDLVISCACFVILFVAESKRCCSHGTVVRSLASTEGGTAHATTANCCPSFGRRTYGGLGNIEPFTSLITVRVIRFIVAWKIIHWLERARNGTVTNTDGKDEENLGGELDSSHQNQTVQSMKSTSKRKSKEEEPGTLVELWERALGKYPEIVSKYGEFSGELLQAMLGIEVVDVLDNKDELLLNTVVSGEERPTALDVPLSEVGVTTESALKNNLLNDKRFSRLLPAVQAVILAGMLGKSIKSTEIKNTSSFVESEDSLAHDDDLDKARSVLPASSTNPANRDHKKPRLPSRDEPPLDSTEKPFEFEIDSSAVDAELDRVVALFDHPNSRLVRGMRRCDRKFLPYLGHWTAVDVVLTKYELVYFDAAEVYNTPHLNTEAHVSHKIEAIREAIIATSGGKGLRLCDVAYGRKVAGRIKLVDCICAHIDRYLPSNISEEVQVGVDGEVNESSDMVQVEFWKNAGRKASDAVSRNGRWERIKEDQLVILTDSGTLQLRFYGDLEYSEAHVERDAKENDQDAPLYKNIALQWCQTIVRYCGTDQLKQELPHFGENSVDELRDYLHVIDRADHFHRRGLASASLLLRRHHHRSGTPDLANIVTRLQRISQRQSSIGEAEESDNSNSNNNSDRPRSRLQDIVRRASAMAAPESDSSIDRPQSHGRSSGLMPIPQKLSQRSVSLGDAERNSSDGGGAEDRPFATSLRLGILLPKSPRRRMWTTGSAGDLPPLVENQSSVDSAPGYGTHPVV